jgi:MFS family permease
LSRPKLRADLTPLRTSRDFRLLYASRTVTGLGTDATEVALLVQARQLTGSTFAVGLLGAVELVPLVVFGLYGGVLADGFDRRRLIVACEAGLACCAALLMLNAIEPHPAVWPLYVVTALMMAAAALQRPSPRRRCRAWCPGISSPPPPLMSMSQNVEQPGRDHAGRRARRRSGPGIRVRPGHGQLRDLVRLPLAGPSAAHR